MTDQPFIRRTDDEKAAAARKDNAEAALFEAKRDTEASEASARALYLREQRKLSKMSDDKYAMYEASDDQRRTYRFSGSVSTQSSSSAIDALVRWHRLDSEAPMTFVINSPGGDIISGFHLFDTMLWLRREGHEITTVATGMAASMGGVLFQAGSHRIMTPQASLLIHEAQFATGGSMGTVEDEVEYVKKLQKRILNILAERSTLSEAQIKRRWTRKNWWLMAQETLDLGFADSIE